MQTDLEKYSYFLYGQKDAQSIEQGTGFFLQKEGKIYLITTAHLIVSWDFKNNLMPYPPIDTFYLRLYQHNSSEPDFIPISSKAYRTSIKTGFAYDVLDLCFIEMGDLSKYQINTIEIDGNNYPVKDDITDVTIWGFPVNDVVNDFSSYMRLPASKSVGILDADYKQNIIWLEYNKSDPYNYQLKITEGECKSGMSGSPIFIKVKNNPHLIFGGMAISGDLITKNIFSIRPEFILKEFFK